MSTLSQETKDLLLSSLGSPEARDDVVDAIENGSLPDQTGQAGKFLSTNGSTSSWETPGGGGTVTNVTASSPLASSGGATPNISFTGTLGISNGGTGQITANAALNAFLPTQTSQSGKALTTNGTNTSWGTFITGAAGSSNQVQFNNSGAFAGSSNFTFDDSINALNVGSSNTASGDESFAAGAGNQATGDQSTALGNLTLASGFASTALGAETVASNDRSFAAGRAVSATGINSAAFGRSTSVGVTGLASGLNSFHLGLDNIASGGSSFASGNLTVASGLRSVTFGSSTQANGGSSLAQGLEAVADGTNSTALGEGTIATANDQLAVGQFNTVVGTPGAPASTDHLFTVGIGGDSSTRADGFYITRAGFLVSPVTHTPASASATGVTGQIAWDSGFIYVCIATDTWVRVATATW